LKAGVKFSFDTHDFLENASVSLHCVGPDGTILWANREELNTLGYTWDEFIGKPIQRIHADANVVEDILRRLMNDETLRDYPARLKHKDGEIVHVIINSSVRFDEDGRFLHTRCFTRNVTAARLAEVEREKRESEEREMDARMQAMALARLSRRLEREQNISLSLLHQMFPKQVTALLRAGKPVPPEAFECVTIFFSDIEGFTTIASEVDPIDVVHLLNRLYIVMDYCASLLPVYKVETIGDAYMVVGGLIEPDCHHAAAVADFSILVRHCVQVVTNPACDDAPIRLRMGVHCGGIVAGVVGTLMPRYCLFGDTVNTASRMESTSAAGQIQCSELVADALLADEGHVLEERGLVEVKGKGPMRTYWLQGGDEGNARCNAEACESALHTAHDLVETVGMQQSYSLFERKYTPPCVNDASLLALAR